MSRGRTTLEGAEIESIFLTGGSGYLGKHLRNRLAASDITVTVFARSGTEVADRPNETVVRGNLTDPDSIRFNDEDAVVHLAAQTSVDTAVESPRETWTVNADGTLNLLEAARDIELTTFLYASTASVYGPPKHLPIDEGHPLNPVEPYGASKAAGDRLTYSYSRAYNVPSVIGRLFNTYGPGQSMHNVIPAIIRQALQDDVIELGKLTPSRDFIYVADAVEALVTLLVRGEVGEAYNVGSGSEIQISTLSETIRDLVGTDADIVSVSEKVRDDDIEIPRIVCDATKIKSLGWTPQYDLKTGLEETISALEESEQVDDPNIN